MNLIRVGISDYSISRAPNKLITLGLGSCVGIAIYHQEAKIGGLSHILLPDSTTFAIIDKPEKFANLALPEMINRIRRKVGDEDLVAKIVGGSSMFFVPVDSRFEKVGDKNVKAVKEILNNFNIPIIGSHTGGKLSRTMTVDLDTFDVLVTVGSKQIAKI